MLTLGDLNIKSVDSTSLFFSFLGVGDPFFELCLEFLLELDSCEIEATQDFKL